MKQPMRLRGVVRRMAALMLAGMATYCSPQAQKPTMGSRIAPGQTSPPAESAEYQQVQERLAQGWNTWDVHSVITQVLLPEGLAIHAELKHNTRGSTTARCTTAQRTIRGSTYSNTPTSV